MSDLRIRVNSLPIRNRPLHVAYFYIFLVQVLKKKREKNCTRGRSLSPLYGT